VTLTGRNDGAGLPDRADRGNQAAGLEILLIFEDGDRAKGTALARSTRSTGLRCDNTSTPFQTEVFDALPDRALDAVEHRHHHHDGQCGEDDADEREERAERMPVHFLEAVADSSSCMAGLLRSSTLRSVQTTDARMAGYMPKTRPVPAAKTMAQTAVPTGDRCRIAGKSGDAVCEELSDHDAEKAAHHRDQNGLGKELEQDLRRRGAQALRFTTSRTAR